MKRDETQINGCKMITETFESFREFKNINDNRDVLWTVRSDGTRDIKYDYDFRKADSYEEAEGYLLYGLNENVDRMVSRVKMLQKTGKTKKTRRYSDVAGYAPIVPNAILGLPNSMMNQKRVLVKSKIVTVVFDPSCPWYVSHNEILEYGCKVVNQIMNLEKSGYRVRLEYLCSNSDDTTHPKRQYVLRMLLKHENQPVNVKRLAFAMTHAAMQRYMTFDWMERLPGSKKLSSFGYSLPVSPGAKENILQTLSGNEYLIWHGADLDAIFNDLK